MPQGLLESGVHTRLRQIEGGMDTGRPLLVSDLTPGMVGIIEVEVRQVMPARTYPRRRGGEGLLAKVVLGDRSGEVEMTLWDEETAQIAAGPFVPGALLRIAGATVKAGFRGGIELGLGVARVLPMAEATRGTGMVEGVLESVGPTRIVGDGPNQAFQADAKICQDGIPRQVVLTGPLLLQVRVLALGSALRLEPVEANTAVDNWWWTTPATTCVILGGPRNP